MELPCPFKRFVGQKGFTLIELMVVVVILTILSGVAIPSFATYNKNQSLKQAQENLKSDLRSIQNKALTGTGSDTVISGVVVRYWAVSYTAGASQYSVYLTSDANCDTTTGTTLQQTFSLPANITFDSATTSRCLLISFLDGSIIPSSGSDTYYNIDLKYSGVTATKRITVNKSGLIYSSN